MNKEQKKETPLQQTINYFLELKGLDWREVKYSRYCRPAKQLLEYFDGDIEKAKKKIDDLKDWADKNGLEWSLSTIFRRVEILLHNK